ncbi:hypothetical protein [Modestobacter sp. KNN46-3]|uniref:hypothetical protein n=1 Tax=Modestobacter sp. KNN46-3 TaxID=2711218 RepID=UPI0013E00EC7|nr:hypothetical protein [Modestobacter sp. KNN46-3]
MARMVLTDDTVPPGVSALLKMSVAELLAVDNLRAGERIRGAAAPAIDVACAVLQWPALATFALVLPKPDSLAGKGGRKMDYPPLLILVYAVLERVYRTGTRVDAEMRNPYNWLRFRDAYRRLTGEWLREQPMTWAQFEYYRDRYLAPKHKKGQPIDTGVYDPANPTVLQTLIRHLGVTSVELVRELGGFPEDKINLQTPNPLNAVHGDGSQKKANSGVREYTDTFADGSTQTRLYGSRATVGTPRVQRVFTDATADGKSGEGLNMVGLYWRHPERTDSRVVLFTGMAPGAEKEVAFPAVRQVKGLVGHALQFLIYDGLFDGLPIDALLAEGVITVNKPPQADTGKKATTRSTNRTRRPDLTPETMPIATHRADGREVRTAAEKMRLRGAEFQRTIRTVLDDPDYRDPVGQRTFLTPSGKAKQKATLASFDFAPADHERADGTVCQHGLVADDQALWEWRPDQVTGEKIKTTLEPLERVGAALPQDTEGRHYLQLDYRIPCKHGDFTHRIELRPDLSGRRQRTRPTRLLRVLPEAYAEAFHAVFDVRNDAEAANSSYNATLYIQGRAQSLDAHAQLLDWLAWALLNNALTYVHHFAAGLEAGHKPKNTSKAARTA